MVGGGWVKSYLGTRNRQISALDETADASLFSLVFPLSNDDNDHSSNRPSLCTHGSVLPGITVQTSRYLE